MNILFVCDDNNFATDFISRLVFLRKNDEVCKSSYKEALSDIAIKRSEIVLIYEKTNDETVNLIKQIKEKTESLIILVSKDCEQDFVLSCYDAGINDFVQADIPDYELVIRVINNIKYNSIRQEKERYSQILKQVKILDEVTGIFKYKYAKQVIENHIDNNIISNGTFMVVSPAQKGKAEFSSDSFLNALKTSIRKDDIIAHGKGVNFYVLMPETDMNGAVFILNKIKSKLSFPVCAGISDIEEKPFAKFEFEALKALSEATILETDFKFSEKVDDDTLDEWLTDKSLNDYRIFRQMFNKKLEKVITPVFYRLQKTYEEKLFNTEIDQFITEEQCVFSLKNKKGNSSLRIIYPGFAKIIIVITHEGLDSPENREIKIPLTKISEKELVEIVENFIKEYKENVIGRR